MVQEGRKEEAMLKFWEIIMRHRKRAERRRRGERKEFVHLD